jgi:sulfite oxidase
VCCTAQVASYFTPNELYFKRNHLPVPPAPSDPSQWRLTVSGEGVVRRSFTVSELQALFPRHTVAVTTQCAGNRRNELNPVKPVKGLAWGAAAISTAEWSGVRLRDVLQHCGLSAEQSGAVAHVQFEGADCDPNTGTRYGASIPLSKAMDARGDVLLAFEMNGKPLPGTYTTTRPASFSTLPSHKCFVV